MDSFLDAAEAELRGKESEALADHERCRCKIDGCYPHEQYIVYCPLHAAAAAMHAALKALKVRICFIGHPGEAKDEQGRPYWAPEVQALEAALRRADGSQP